jgi:hypothetical protein
MGFRSISVKRRCVGEGHAQFSLLACRPEKGPYRRLQALGWQSSESARMRSGRSAVCVHSSAVETGSQRPPRDGFKDTKVTQHETVDADHGRIETRTYTVMHDVAWKLLAARGYEVDAS